MDFIVNSNYMLLYSNNSEIQEAEKADEVKETVNDEVLDTPVESHRLLVKYLIYMYLTQENIHRAEDDALVISPSSLLRVPKVGWWVGTHTLPTHQPIDHYRTAKHCYDIVSLPNLDWLRGSSQQDDRPVIVTKCESDIHLQAIAPIFAITIPMVRRGDSEFP